METDGTASDQSLNVEMSLPDGYRILNNQRIDIDRRMMMLAPNDPARDILWQDLERVLVKLRETVGRLAKSPATRLPEIRAKADVLATLLRSGDDSAGPVIPEDERSGLALSLVEDIARLWGE